MPLRPSKAFPLHHDGPTQCDEWRRVTGPIPVDDPWGAFADDQLGMMDQLRIQKFFFKGYCIGGPFALKLMERAPDRVVAAVLC
jgi:pimeloyl-ACP methyl ester carboxylesterase